MFIKSVKLIAQFGHGKKAWFKKHINDIYVKKANQSNYRSRASFKLLQLFQKHPLILFPKNSQSLKQLSKINLSQIKQSTTKTVDIENSNQTSDQKQINNQLVRKVFDLGCAPGSWSQILREVLPKAEIAAVDILEMKPIQGVDFYKTDARNKQLQQKLIKKYGKFQLFVSDMAPNFTGDTDQTHQQILQLNLLCVQFCFIMGSPSCSLIMKSVQGKTQKNFYNLLSGLFTKVYREKPASSRSQSVQFFYVCQKLKQQKKQKQMIELLDKIKQNVIQELQKFKDKKGVQKFIDNYLNGQ